MSHFYLSMLNHPCTFIMNPKLLWWLIFPICNWVQSFGGVYFLRMLVSVMLQESHRRGWCIDVVNQFYACGILSHVLLVLVLAAPLLNQLPAYGLGVWRRVVQILGSLHPSGKLGRSSWPLTLNQLRSGHLGCSEVWASRWRFIYLSFYL